MAHKFSVGDKVIAKSTHINLGFRKGDVILVTKNSSFPGDFIGENLSNPNCYGNPWVYIGQTFRGKLIKDSQISHRVYILGIPVFTIRKEPHHDAN